MKKSVQASIAFVVLAVFAANPASAQGIYLGLRGGAGVPTGAFSDNSASQTTLDAA